MSGKHEYRIIESYRSIDEKVYRLQHRLKYKNPIIDFFCGQEWMTLNSESVRESNLKLCFYTTSKEEIDDFLLWNKEQDLKMYN